MYYCESNSLCSKQASSFLGFGTMMASLVPASSLTDERFDSLVVISDSFDRLTGIYETLKEPLETYAQVSYW